MKQQDKKNVNNQDTEANNQDTEAKAAMLAAAGKLYVELADLAATVTVESNEARIKAVGKASEFIKTGVSLRAAAEAVGRKADTSLDRFTTVARASDKDSGIKPPTPYKTWHDAIAHQSLRAMVKHIRDSRGRKNRKAMSNEQRAVKILRSNLKQIHSLTLKSKSNKRRGIIVTAESLNQYVTAWLDCGLDLDHKDMAAMSLTMVTRKPVAVDSHGQTVQDALDKAQDTMGQGQEVTRAVA